MKRFKAECGDYCSHPAMYLNDDAILIIYYNRLMTLELMISGLVKSNDEIKKGKDYK